MSFLQVNDWPQVAAWLFAELKLSENKANLNALKSRYLTIAREFESTDFTRDNFNKFIYSRKIHGYKPASLNNLIKMAKHIAAYYKINDFDSVSYYKEVPATHEYITPDLVKKLAEVNIEYGKARDETNLKYKALIYFLGLSGCRSCEAFNLRRADFAKGPDGFHAIFRDTKNGDTRIIPVPDFVGDMMERLPVRSNYVFTSYRGNKLDEATVNLDLKRRSEAIGNKTRIHAHLFRYSFITTLIKSDVKLSCIARIVGHRDIKTTDRYTLLELSELRDALSSHPLLKEVLEIEAIIALTKKFYGKLIDLTRYRLGITAGGDELNVKVVKICK